MILHLSPGSGSIELHFHDDAQVALYQPSDSPALADGIPAATSGRTPHWFLFGLTGALCLALGYGLAPHGSAAPTRVAGSPVTVQPLTPLPGNLPLVPNAVPPRPYQPDTIVPVARPRAEAETADGVPLAVARQLAQVPVVVPPAAPSRPPASSSAFGLEN